MNTLNFIVTATLFFFFLLSGCTDKALPELAKEKLELDHLDFMEFKCAKCHWKADAVKFNHGEYLGKKKCVACHEQRNLDLVKHESLREKEKCEKCHIPFDDPMHSVQKHCPACHTTENWERKKDEG